jgi:phosphomannomutase / phosphoglucomutase
MTIAAGIFRQYDIRGVVGDDLTVEAAEGIGRAYAALLDERGIAGPVAVGRDNRPSGTALRDALVRGLTTRGRDVIDIGVGPTPLLYWSLHHLPVAGGIQITGSHNPPEFNGFKICVGTGSLHGGGIQRLRELLDAPATARVGSVRTEDLNAAYADDIVARTGPLPRRLKVVPVVRSRRRSSRG